MISDIKDDTIAFAVNHLESSQKRDYGDLLELVVIFLGGCPTRGVRFMALGALSHTQWMAKAIYSLKIYLF